MKIDYLAIIKNAWKIAWENKFLWWFGFFILLGSGFQTNFSFPKSSNQNWNAASIPAANFILNEKGILIGGIIFLILLVAFFIYLSIRGKAAMIKSIGKVMKKESCNFSVGFRSGKKYFWKIFILGGILIFVVFGLVILLSVPVAFLFLMKAYFLAVVSAILAVAILVPVAILSVFINLYALIYITLADLSVPEAIENAYLVFRKNILPSVLMVLFFILFRAVLFFAAVLALISILVLFGPTIIISYLFFPQIGLSFIGISVLIVFLSLLAVLNSIYNAFSQAVWILFFNEIAKQKKEETAEEKETFPIKVPKPEEA